MKRIKIRNGRMKFNKKIFALRTRLKGRMKMEQKKTEEIFKIKKIKSKSSKRMKKRRKSGLIYLLRKSVSEIFPDLTSELPI